MKNFKKLATAALTIIALSISNNLMAQAMMSQTTTPNPWRFGIGLETGLPIGSLHKATMVELGGTARLQYDVSPNFDLMLTSGYYNFFPGSYSSTTTTIGPSTYATKAHSQGIIPVKAGFKIFFGKSFYYSGEAGVGFETQYNEDKKLILSPGLGVANSTWDISVRYENFSGQSTNYGLVGARIAYGFKL